MTQRRVAVPPDMPLDADNSINGNDDVSGDDENVTTIHVRRRAAGKRLDKFLSHRFPRMSRTTLQRLIKEGGVTVNGLPTKASYEPADGDRVDVLIPPPQPTDVIPEDIPLDILYEDDHMLAINKQPGIICHPARYGQTGTLANALAHYSQSLSRTTDDFRPGIIHRLDKNTTGVMLVAKCDEAHWRLSLQFERRTIQKMYVAIVEGSPPLDSDVIDQPLANNPLIKDRYITPGRPLRGGGSAGDAFRCTAPSTAGGSRRASPGRDVRGLLFKEAVTHYKVLERFNGFSFVQLSPRTGRTHQLRVHMSSIGFPIFGDTHYGGHLFSERDLSGAATAPTDPLFAYQALHAHRIQFTHPIKETRLAIEAPYPPSMQHVLSLLRAHRGG